MDELERRWEVRARGTGERREELNFEIRQTGEMGIRFREQDAVSLHACETEKRQPNMSCLWQGH